MQVLCDLRVLFLIFNCQTPACVDVFDMEPPIPADYPLLSAKNTLLTPHQAFISEESMLRRAKIVFDNVYAFLEGNPINVCK